VKLKDSQLEIGSEKKKVQAVEKKWKRGCQLRHRDAKEQ